MSITTTTHLNFRGQAREALEHYAAAFGGSVVALPFAQAGDERAYLFGRGGARRKAEAMQVPFLGEVPLNLFLRESGDVGRIEQALRDGSPSKPYLMAMVENLAAQISIQNLKNPKMPKLEILN